MKSHLISSFSKVWAAPKLLRLLPGVNVLSRPYANTNTFALPLRRPLFVDAIQRQSLGGAQTFSVSTGGENAGDDDSIAEGSIGLPHLACIHSLPANASGTKTWAAPKLLRHQQGVDPQRPRSSCSRRRRPPVIGQGPTGRLQGQPHLKVWAPPKLSRSVESMKTMGATRPPKQKMPFRPPKA